jgi:hypothetical protein
VYAAAPSTDEFTSVYDIMINPEDVEEPRLITFYSHGTTMHREGRQREGEREGEGEEERGRGNNSCLHLKDLLPNIHNVTIQVPKNMSSTITDKPSTVSRLW